MCKLYVDSFGPFESKPWPEVQEIVVEVYLVGPYDIFVMWFYG